MIQTIILVILSILSLLAISFIHELGHYVFAKTFRFNVPEFGIGVGKTLLRKKDKYGTVWKLNLFPVVSYVKIAGMEKKDIHVENGYFKKPIYQRFLTIFGGPFFNLILAFIIFFMLFSFKGYQSNIIESSMVPNLKQGDIILQVNNHKTSDYSDISKYLFMSNGSVEIVVKRNGKIIKERVNKTNATLFYPLNKKGNFFATIKEDWKFFINYTELFFYTIASLFSSHPVVPTSQAVAGPIGIVAIMIKFLKENLSTLIPLVGLISFALGITNLLPVPALDGFWLVLLFIEKIFKIKPHRVIVIQETGYVTLLILSAIIAIKDIYFFIIK